MIIYLWFTQGRWFIARVGVGSGVDEDKRSFGIALCQYVNQLAIKFALLWDALRVHVCRFPFVSVMQMGFVITRGFDKIAGGSCVRKTKMQTLANRLP